jgi:hypothetical protein
MANVRKRILQLTPLPSASLDTTIVGVDNGVTYRIELDVLADAVTNRVNTLDRDRLNSLESVTSSFETKGRSVISSSAQITALGFISSSTIIPVGTISSSTQISDFGFVSTSVDISALNSFTQSFSSSQNILNTAFINGISARLQTSSFNDFSASVHSEIVAATNEQSFDGLISGSSQLTSSFDARYVLSGSITQTTWDNIDGKPNGLVSQSTDLSSINTFTQSIDGRVDSLESWSSSLSDTFATDLEVSIVSSSVAATIGIISQNTGLLSTSSFNEYTASISTASLVTSIDNLNTFTASQSTSSLVDRLNIIESVSGSWITESETGSFLTSLSGAISSSSQLTSSYDARYTLSGSVQPLPSNLVSSSAQITAFGFISSSIAIPAGTISGSSQLTSSFDTRYILSGSLTAGSNVSVSDTAPTSPTEGDLWWKSNDGNLYMYYDSYWIVATDTISAIPNGVISGSAQITTLGFVSGSYETTGRGIISGSAQLPSGLISGSSQLTTSFPSKTTGTWTLPTGASIQSFTVEAGHTYSMWVNGNVPNGIITWNATVTLSNTNVPVVGSQYGWYYTAGNALVLTSIPDQIIGTNGGIITSPSSYSPNTSNVFNFGITNNSETTQTINYGYIKLS